MALRHVESSPVRKLLVGLAALVLLCSGVGKALADSDPTYPVTSLTDWWTGPQSDWSHPERGLYTYQAGFAGAVNRALTRWPQHYNPATVFQHLAEESQAATDAAFHAHPGLPYDPVGDAGSPDYMPDFNGNGTFGDAGDFDSDTDETMGTAPFRYPCPQLDGNVLYETTDGSCAPATAAGVTFKLGEVREAKIVDARGYILDASVWLPGEAVTGPTSGPLPGIVFSNGFDSRQDSYYWFAMRAARAGYVVLTYDPAGQGQSEGTGAALFDQRMTPCQIGGACRDLEDAVRWFTGADIQPSPRDELRATAPKNPAYSPAGDNLKNPALGLLDTMRVSIAGNSMGAIASINYVRNVGVGHGGDGRPLPAIRAAVPMSGAAPALAAVPMQFQTSDYDGSPTLLGPGVGGVSLGDPAWAGIGYSNVKLMYDRLRTSGQGSGALEVVVLEGGTHADHLDIPGATRTAWSLAVAGDAALDFVGCHALDDSGACQRAASPRPRLSRVFASEQDADGPAGPEPSRCVTVPDRNHLNQYPTNFIATAMGGRTYTCSA